MIETFKSRIEDENSYILFDGNSKEVIVVDPGNARAMEEYLDQHKLKIRYIFLTHEHYDHICGLNELRKLYSFEVIASQQCNEGIQDTKRNMSRYANVTRFFKQGEIEDTVVEFICEETDIKFVSYLELNWNKHKLEFFETPGHSKGSSMFIFDKKYLFSGDTILKNQMVFTKFTGGSLQEYESITVPKIQNLNRNIKVLPGHGDGFFLHESIINL